MWCVALLVCDQGLLGLLETGAANEKGPEGRESTLAFVPKANRHLVVSNWRRNQHWCPRPGLRRDTVPGAPYPFPTPIGSSHLGSVMPAVCLTRPQYVPRSYWESGSARPPGREADMLAMVSRGVSSKGVEENDGDDEKKEGQDAVNRRE